MRALELALVLGLGILICMPVLLLFCGSLADGLEWMERMEPMLLDNMEYIGWKWIPDYPTLENFKELLFLTPEFLKLFWNSVKIAVFILAGQLLVGTPSAWAFAAYDFKGKNILFSIYVILMLLPFQVTMLARYLVLNGLGLLDTHAAVILPAVFSTFPVFLIYRGFRGIPKDLYEVARIDGAGEFLIFLKVGLPLAEGSVMAAFVLGFFEVWNLMEEPLAFLKDMSLWPLSLYLPEIGAAQAGRACAASVLALVVSLLVFGIFRDSLEQGIVSSALKG
ncbi:MAG: carbohydrate ABC transporter permease [Lachnospiraceae bacterium]|jgi:multiple sugar transport system permease protein|nr:carbohydrate ABC transporter permease [Lachnospiraceae bacterium]